MVSPAEAVAAMPDDLPAAEAAPLLCAGITVFKPSAMPAREAEIWSRSRESEGSDTWASNTRAGWVWRLPRSVRGTDKEPLARKLGAHHYIDTNAGSPAEALQKLGGARVALATAPDAKSISSLVGGLAPGGKLLVIGAAFEPLSISALDLIGARRSVQGWPSGTAMDSEDTLRFSALTGIRPMIEKFPLSKVAEAYERMESGKVRFRAVLVM